MSKFNNIDDAIRNSFENFEVPFDASQWNLLENNMDNAGSNDLTSFDKKVKESVNSHEAAYNPVAWTTVESQLTASGYSYTKWIIAAGIVGIVSLGTYFILNDSETEKSEQQDKKAKLAENKTVKPQNEPSENVVSFNEPENISEESDIVDEKIIPTNNVVIPEKKTPVLEPKDEIIPETFLGDNQKENKKNEPTVTKWSIPAPQIFGQAVYCKGEVVKLSSPEVSEKVNIQWSLNGNVLGNQKEISLDNLSEGTYEIELIHTAKNEFASNCVKPEMKKALSVIIKENNKTDFKFAQEGDAWYPETKFTVLSPEKNTNYSWIIDNKMLSGEEAIYLFNKKGTYPVSLMAENENGCTSTETKNVEISTDYNLLAPIAFTPNFDGLNDVFIPEALKYLNLQFKINIYDRQQGLVFQSNRSDYAWDGKNINTGEMCSQGAYLWVVELTNKEGDVEQYSGTITILK